jgi:hypothetical protein
MKLLVMQFSPFSRHLIPLQSTYPPQHAVAAVGVLYLSALKPCLSGSDRLKGKEMKNKREGPSADRTGK